MRRIALMGTLSAVVSTLLIAGSANAEPVDGVAVVDGLAPVEQTTSALSEAEPEAVETQEVTGAADTGNESAESDPATSAPGASTGAEPSSAAAVHSLSGIDDATPSTAAEVTAPIEPRSGTAATTAVRRQVAGLVESVRRDSAATSESLKQAAAEATAPVTNRLADASTRPAFELADGPLKKIVRWSSAVLTPLLGPLAPATVEVLLPAAAEPTLDTTGEPAADRSLDFPGLPWAGLMSGQDLAGAGWSTKDELAQLDSAGLVRWSSSTRSDEAAKLQPAASGGVYAASATVGRPESPRPFDAPASPPGAIVSGFGGSIFVPIAALLALLALIVPATLRRRWEVSGFPAPTQFVCALERPG